MKSSTHITAQRQLRPLWVSWPNLLPVTSLLLYGSNRPQGLLGLDVPTGDGKSNSTLLLCCKLGFWTWIRLCLACHRGPQIRRGMGTVFAPQLPCQHRDSQRPDGDVRAQTHGAHVVLMVVVMVVVAVPSLLVRVLHNVLYLLSHLKGLNAGEV